jgi:hypothetical protein
MGQAKQRKRVMGDRYGKESNPWDNNKSHLLFNQMTKDLQPGYLPDYGHWYIKTFGEIEQYWMTLCGECVFDGGDRDGAMIGMTICNDEGEPSFALSVIIPSDLFTFDVPPILVPRLALPEGLAVSATISQKDRYCTKDNQWIIPFRATSIKSGSFDEWKDKINLF